METETILILDTETTGLNASESGLVEIAAVAVRDREIIGDWSSLVWPGRHNLTGPHREVLRISGITLEILMDAPEPGEVAFGFREWLRNLGISDLPRATSFNRAFDKPFLDRLPIALFWQPCLMFRAMERMNADNALIRRRDGTWKYPRLSEAALHFGVPCLDTHRALSDARAAARIWIALEERKAP